MFYVNLMPEKRAPISKYAHKLNISIIGVTNGMIEEPQRWTF
jgi:hypothetical protein